MAAETEKPEIGSHITPESRAIPFTIPRKPLGAQNITPVNDEEVAPNIRQPNSTWTNRISRRWHGISRRARAIVVGTTIVILVLVIGLAAGLAVRNNGPSNLPLPSKFGGPYSGDLTYYAPGLGACGIESSDGDKIVALSYLLFDAVQEGSDPNSNPLCGKQIRVRRKGGDESIDLTVVDRCTGCQPNDLDVTEDTFAELADIDLGRVTCEWSWLDSHASRKI